MAAENGAKLVLVSGGARSGKSTFALARAAAFGPRRLFVATAEPLDQEMTARIRQHRIERAERFAGFETVEEPLALADALTRLQASGGADVLLVDCLTLWMSNLLVRGDEDRAVTEAAAQLVSVLERRTTNIVLVTNEVGQGLVPETPLGRRFRDHVGTLTQQIAQRADEVYGTISGMIVRVRPAPLAVCDANSLLATDSLDPRAIKA